MRRRGVVRGLAVLALAGGALPVASCNLALGLNKYIDCPGDPSCPADATCSNGVKDGEETGTDCGGPCKACPDAQGCKVASDCTSNVCVQGMCIASTCNDKVKDGNETDVDCGGSCSPCADGKGCATGTDCVDKSCSGGICLMPACNDNVQNGSETDVDCGGNDTCPRCGEGKICTQSSDCAGMICMGGTCQPTCGDGQKDGQETAVDCGGPKCMKCADTKGCMTDADCQSGICQSNACATIYEFSASFPDSVVGDTVTNVSVTVDGSNNVLIAGSFAGTVNFGSSPLTSSGTNGNPPTSGFLAKFDASGTATWSMLLPDIDGEDQVAAATTDASGDIYINGYFEVSSPLAIACPPNPMATVSTFVGKLDSFGDPVWCNAYGTDFGPLGGPMAVDHGGNLVLALFTAGGTTDFGGGPLTAPNPAGGTYLVKLDSTGKYVWAKLFTGAETQSVSVDASNNIIISGSFFSSVNFGGPTLTNQGSGDVFVAKFDPMGNYLWSNGYGDAQDQSSASSVVDAMGNILLAGDYSGTLNFGGTPLTSAGATDIFAAKLDSNGNHLWSKSFGDPAAQSFSGMSLDPTGQPVLTGTFAGTINFGGSTFTSSGGPVMGTDIFVAKLDIAGNHLWSRSFGTVAGQTVGNIALDKAGSAWLTGAFDGTLNFGTTPATNLVNPMGGATVFDANDIFLAKLLTP